MLVFFLYYYYLHNTTKLREYAPRLAACELRNGDAINLNRGASWQASHSECGASRRIFWEILTINGINKTKIINIHKKYCALDYFGQVRASMSNDGLKVLQHLSGLSRYAPLSQSLGSGIHTNTSRYIDHTISLHSLQY